MLDKSTEPTAKETQPKEGASISPKQGAAYSLISRTLIEKDLQNTAVVKMIINDRDDLQAENTELKSSVALCKALEVDNAVLKSRLKTFTAFEVISTGTIAIGSVFIGAAINPFQVVLFMLGFGLVAVGVIAKYIKIT